MLLETSNTTLKGLKGLVVGIANQHSIAWGCAEAFRAAGAELAITYLNAKAEPHVRPLAEGVNATLIEAMDVENDAKWVRSLKKLKKNGVNSISFCTPLLLRLWMICMARYLIPAVKALPAPWIFPATA